MKITHKILIGILFMVQFIYSPVAFCQLPFFKFIETEYNMHPNNILEINNSYYVSVGNNGRSGNQGYFTSIYKFSKNGDYFNKIDIDTLSFFSGFTILNDSELAMVGSIFNFQTDSFDLCYLKIDTNLQICLDKRYHCLNGGIGGSILKDNNLIFFIGLLSNSTNYSKFFAKFNLNGDTLATKITYYATYPWFESDILKNPENNHLYIFSSIVSETVDQIDTNLNEISTDVLNPVGNYILNNSCSVIKFTDSTYLLACNYIPIGSDPNYADIGVAEISLPANLINTYHYGAKADTSNHIADYRSIDYFTKNNIYVCGTSNFVSYIQSEPSWIYIISLDSNLNFKKQICFGGDRFYIPETIKATSDGGVVVAGYWSNLNDENSLNFFILKLDSTLTYNSINGVGLQPEIISVYPNPGNDKLFIEYKNNSTGFPIIDLFDMNGKFLLSKNLKEGINEINAGEFADGVYLYKINTGKSPVSGKWVKNGRSVK
ncbi:MAG: T9SS type A sorting domain-containing protein [Bacteroidia bacterium]|nr:T9SS type A sorting domain-containing protein [Bacteroidia bacterium]